MCQIILFFFEKKEKLKKKIDGCAQKFRSILEVNKKIKNLNKLLLQYLISTFSQ